MKRLCIPLTNCFLAWTLLISCNNDYFDAPPPTVSQLPSKETHYNFETGEKIGQKSFKYDQSGRVIREYFTSDLSENFQDVRYEYDNDNNLLKKMTMDAMSDGKFFVNEYRYQDGLKISESMSFDGVPVGYRTLYFYSENRIDSAQRSFYNTIDVRYQYMGTTLYEYDNLNRLVKTYDKDTNGTTVFRYEGNNLKESCNLMKGYLGVDYETCVVNEYNAIGGLIKISDVSFWGRELREEFFYKDGLLIEKKVYTYPAYEPGNTVDITLMVYDY
jgi:hypothetical protein